MFKIETNNQMSKVTAMQKHKQSTKDTQMSKPNVADNKDSVNPDVIVFVKPPLPNPEFTYIPRFVFNLPLSFEVLGAILFVISYHQEWLQYLDGLIDYFESKPSEFSHEQAEIYLKDLESKYEAFIGGAK